MSSSPWRQWSTAALGGACLGLLSVSAGCIQLAAAWANITGGDWIDPEYKLTTGPLAVVMDDLNGVVTEPRAFEEVHKTLSAIFLEYNVNRRLVPFEDCQRLRQTDPQYDTLPIHRIGEKLGAEQVLYLNVSRFKLRSEPGVPVFAAEFGVRVKVISTKPGEGDDYRLWPDDEAGKFVSATTSPEPADGDRTAIDVAREVSIKLGQAVAGLFYGRRSLEKQ